MVVGRGRGTRGRIAGGCERAVMGASDSDERPGPEFLRYGISGCNGEPLSALITCGRVIESTAMSYDIDRLSPLGAVTPESRFRCIEREESPKYISREKRLPD